MKNIKNKQFLSCLLICSILLGTALSVELAACQVTEGPTRIINQYVELTFTSSFAGDAFATIATAYPPPPTFSPTPPPDTAYGQPALSSSASGTGFVAVWDIKVTGSYSDGVFVTIRNSARITQMFQTDIVPGDVNHDGKVNLCDLVIIAIAVGSTPGSHRWNPSCDLNHDGKVNLQDLSIAIHNLGKTSTWTDITFSGESGYDSNYPSAPYYVVGETDHFSLFGVH